MNISPLLLKLLLTAASAEESSITQYLNELLQKSRTTIEETTLNVRPSGLKLPIRSLNWPTPSNGSEQYAVHPCKGSGLILEGKKGGEVHAPASGVIKYVGPMGKHDSVVIVDHRQQLKTIFIGLDKNTVKRGQSVYSGQRFARLPAYGRNVHEYFFELRHKGKAIDPLPYMKRRG